MSILVRVSNPDLAEFVPPPELVEFADDLEAMLAGVEAPPGPDRDARRDALRQLVATAATLVEAQDPTHVAVLDGSEDSAQSGEDATEDDTSGAPAYVVSFAADDCIGSRTPTSGSGWDDSTDGCSFPVWTDADDAAGDPEEAPMYLSVFDSSELDAEIGECTYCLANDTGDEPQGVALYFGLTRTRVVDVQPVGLQVSNLRALPEPKGDLRFVSWHGAACCSSVCLRIRFIGDPPMIRDHTWLFDDPTRPAPDPGDSGFDDNPPCEDPPAEPPPRRASFFDGRLLAAHSLTAEQSFAARRQRIERSKPRGPEDAARKRYQQFFLQLDARTHPTLLARRPGNEALIGDIVRVGGYLRGGYRDRAMRVAENDEASGDRVPGRSFTQRLRSIAEYTEDVMRAPVGGGGPLSSEELSEAFDLFAGGQLTVVDTHGAPNGVNYFSFAELAIRVSALEPWGFWEQLLPVFARSAEIFVNSYHLRGGQRRSCAYAVANNPRGERGYSTEEREALAELWDTLTFEESVLRFGHIVAAALADELSWSPDYRRPSIVAILRDH